MKQFTQYFEDRNVTFRKDGYNYIVDVQNLYDDDECYTFSDYYDALVCFHELTDGRNVL